MQLKDDFYVPYESAEHAFFCALSRREAQADGARLRAGPVMRAGGGLDVEIIVKRLHQTGKLSREHIYVMRWYGKRGVRPDSSHWKETRAAKLWDEAMDLIGSELQRKGLIYG